MTGHRRNEPYCAKCGGTCLYDDQGRILRPDEITAQRRASFYPSMHPDVPTAVVELHYPDGTCARWNVSNATGDRVVNMLGTPDTLKC